jgi:hypothetical protein
MNHHAGKSLSARGRSITMKITAFAAGLTDQSDTGGLVRFVEGFAHVVDREGCGCRGNQRFHLDACLGRR